jgi:hypothetical protein
MGYHQQSTRNTIMARKSKEEKRIEAAAEAAFNKVGRGRQFDVMDLGKIHDAGVAAGVAGQDIEAAVSAACDKYEVKAA